MPIHGLSHVTLLARDLDAMERMLVAALDARKVYDSGDDTFSLSPERFYLIGDGPAPVWLAVMQGDPPPRSYQHVAFSIDEEAFEAAGARIARWGSNSAPAAPASRARRARSIFIRPRAICSNCIPGRWRRGWRAMARGGRAERARPVLCGRATRTDANPSPTVGGAGQTP